MNLAELFEGSLERRSGRAALEYSRGDGRLVTLSFGEIDERVNRMAAELTARGLAPGDRLCVQLGNSVHFIVLFLACTRLGAILVPANVQYRERELRHIIQDAEPLAVVVERDPRPPPGSSVRIWPLNELVEASTRRAAARTAGSALERIDEATAALIVYTSGTTGTAKGAVLSHAALTANAVSVTSSWRITEDDRYLAVLPLFHVHGLANGVHAWLTSGCLMRLEQRFDHRSAAALFTDFRPTLFFGVPTIYVRMLDAGVIPRAAAREIGRAARLFVSGSAPLPAHVLEGFRSRFGHTILERYGMTEALMIMTNPYDGERRAGSVGAPFPGVDVRLIDDDGEPAADGAVGEIHVRSPHLYSGYWRNPEATRAAARGEYFGTGDLAVRSADGYYTLRGRRGDVIISGGYNIYPREIEELLLEDPRVREVAVIGISDELYGEVPAAYVVADAELDAAELDARCRAELAPFKLPRAFIRLESLPRTALGKVQRHLLPHPARGAE